MSEYVEARYALLIIEQALMSTDENAKDLIGRLVKDLSPSTIPGAATKKRAQTLQAVRALALSFENHARPPAAYWETAQFAAQQWCKEAAH